MGRTYGKPDVHQTIQVPVLKNHVITSGKHRYVFVQVFSNKVRRLCLEHMDDLALYNRFSQAITRRRYNMVEIYGMDAIDIDNPHAATLSVWLKFKVADESEPCTLLKSDKE